MTVWQRVIDVFWHIVRFIQLWVIFIPPICGFPLLLFERTQGFWLDLFVTAVERAGVVWIKAFQYLSHRRDIIGPEMAQKFIHLRQNAPQHTFQQTRKNFKQNYSKQIQQIFQEFDPVPLASGSVSQVYKAKYHGRKVAVKVRHPGVDKHIKRDVNLLFFFSRLFSLISYSFQIPISQDSMKRTLTQQIDFNIEKENLDIFNKMFEGRKQVKFPFPFASKTSESILVETFVEGVPITYFEKNQHPLNSAIANLGARTFFEMLMKNNFIHADCHGGNIMVELYEESFNFFTEIWGYLKEKYYNLEQLIVESTFDSQTFRKLYVEGRKEEAKIRNLLRKYKEKFRVNLIDVGMVITLDETDKNNFVQFLKAIISSDGEKCAQKIYNLSNFDGKKIPSGQFNDYYLQLKELFSVINGADLDDLDGMKLLAGMLSIIRNHRMKLDGQFATLITNMMVLEAMAKDIDPQINILKCAIPYFSYIKDSRVFETIAEKSRSFLTT